MRHARLLRPLTGLVLISLLGMSSAYADRDHGRHPGFRDPHWTFDSRFHHDHYYPRVGYTLSILPPGYMDIRYRDRHFFFNAGVWFVQQGPRYVVVTPPVGVVVPALPPAVTTVWIGSTPYYYANGIYYAPAPGGYTTVAQPAGYESAVTTPPPPPPNEPARSVAPANDLLFIYPKKNQSEARITSDRMECSSQATSQTGYDPNRATLDDPGRGDYLRAVSSCLENRGYGVK